MIEAQAQHPEERIELWFQDEARFGQQGCNSRMWGERGSRPHVPRQTEYGWLYLFGAVCPATGQSNGWLMPHANTQTMQAYLDDLGRSLTPGVHALLVLDGAGWHQSTRLHVPDNLTLLPLPPYSPELNPAEMLWREMRQRYLSNRVYPSREELDSAVATTWLNLSDNAERIRRVTNFGWIRSAVTLALGNPGIS